MLFRQVIGQLSLKSARTPDKPLLRAPNFWGVIAKDHQCFWERFEWPFVDYIKATAGFRLNQLIAATVALAAAG